MDEAAKAFYNIHMTDSITIEQVWATCNFANMSCVEEATITTGCQADSYVWEIPYTKCGTCPNIA